MLIKAFISREKASPLLRSSRKALLEVIKLQFPCFYSTSYSNKNPRVLFRSEDDVESSLDYLSSINTILLVSASL